MRDPKDREVELSFWESVRESDNPATEDADRLRDVLHALLAEILEAVGELAPDMVVDAARDADAAGLGQPLETHGNNERVLIRRHPEIWTGSACLASALSPRRPEGFCLISVRDPYA
jgi:hypothetical protein